MSERRRLVVLVSLFGALVVLYAVGLMVNRSPAPPVIVPAFDANAVRRVVAGQNILKRNGKKGWEISIEGTWYPADFPRVAALLRVLSGLTADRVASRSRSDWTTFQVDAADAAHLSVEGTGGRLVDLYIGKSSVDGGVYLRSGSSPDVYEVQANLGGYVSAGPSYWSYLRVLPKSVTVDSLQSIAVTAHGFSVGGESVDQSYLLVSSVVAGKNRWVVNGEPKVKLDQQKVLSLEAEILQMEGDRFVSRTTKTGLDHPIAVITVSDQQGGTWSILVGERYGAQFYVRRKDLPYVYLVNQWTLHRAIPRLKTLAVQKG